MKNYQVINSVARSADILQCLSSGVSKITEIAKGLEINKAAVHRILKTLELKGFVVQEPLSRQYFLGPAIQTIAANPLAVHRMLTQAAIEEMRALGKACGETVVLQIIRGGQRVVLEKVAGTDMLRYYPQSMQAAPVHTGAGGRVLLSGLGDVQLNNLLPRLRFEKLTPRTIADLDTLKAKIEEVRVDGYAITRGENVEGAMAIAVPITSYTCPAVLLVVGPEGRLEENKEVILKKLLKAGTTISRKLTA